MRLLISLGAGALLLLGVACRQPPNAVKSFFESRLADRRDAAAPPYESLLRVADSVSAASASDVRAALPSIRSALRSDVPNLPVEGMLVLHAIAQRADGGALLADDLREIARLTQHSDERMSGGAVTVLRMLTRSVPDASVPLLVERLRAPGAPTLVKSEIVRSLLESSRRGDAAVLGAVEAYLALEAAPTVRIATLGALAGSGVKTPAIAAYAVSGLDAKESSVQMASIQAVYALGRVVSDPARAAIARLAGDRATDAEVRAMAERALQNRLAEPR